MLTLALIGTFALLTVLVVSVVWVARLIHRVETIGLDTIAVRLLHWICKVSADTARRIERRDVISSVEAWDNY